MKYKALLRTLKPHNNAITREIEPFEEYTARVGRLIPNWPESAMESWLHRHYPAAVSRYGFLGFDTMSFEARSLSPKDVYDRINTFNLTMLEGQGGHIYGWKSTLRTYLMNYMLDHGTWPTPIIVLGNPTEVRSPFRDPLGAPLHLIEGHLRLGYFRHIYRREPERL
jgi:hypothetical protein